MAFRDKGTADRVRIDALEDELDDKDAEIARLRSELAERDAPKKKTKKGRAAPVPTASDLPVGDVWEVETTHPKGTWKWGLGWLAILAATIAYLGVTGGWRTELLIPLTIFGVPGMTLFRRRGITLDRKAGTITRWDWFLFRRRRTWAVAGKEIELVRRTMYRKNGPSWTAGVAHLGDDELFLMKWGAAEDLSRRVAAFFGIGFRERRETTEEIQRRAHQPLKFVSVVIVLAMIIGGLVILLR
jgi:hypothetical protein